MTSYSRSFFYSLFIHLFLLGAFLFTFIDHPKQETKTALKIKMISLSLPPSAALSKQPTPQPKQEIKPLPVNKPTPIITPPPITQKAVTPIPVEQPKVASQPISRPNIAPVVQAAPLPSAVETPTPKTIHPPAPPPSVNVEKEFVDAHLGEIRTLLIQNLKYPKNALRLKMQGEVRIAFRLKSDGSVDNIEVIKSSGFELLDEDARALIKNTAPQFPKPTKSISLSVPLSYLLH